MSQTNRQQTIQYAFLDSVDELLDIIRDWDPMAKEKRIAGCLDQADELLQKAISQLERQFKLLIERSGDAIDWKQLDVTENNFRLDWMQSCAVENKFRLFSTPNAYDLYRSYSSKPSKTNVTSSDDSEDEELYTRRSLRNENQQDPIQLSHLFADYDIVINVLPSRTTGSLHEIAKRMVAAGFGKECAHVYSICRRRISEQSLSKLWLSGMEPDRLLSWIKAINLAFLILLPSERRLCNQVFFGLSSVADVAFTEVCAEYTIQLLKFADAVANGSRTPDRLLEILHVFQTIRNIMPLLEDVLSGHCCAFLRAEATRILKRLGEAIRRIFVELENLIKVDSVEITDPSGGLRLISRYIMNYLIAVCTLQQAFALSSSYSSSLSAQIAKIVELLESNVETHSKAYSDPTVGYKFLMNSQKYILKKLKNSALRSLLGQDWVQEHLAKLQEYEQYFPNNVQHVGSSKETSYSRLDLEFVSK